MKFIVHTISGCHAEDILDSLHERFPTIQSNRITPRVFEVTDDDMTSEVEYDIGNLLLKEDSVSNFSKE
jgi:hypothetical protein